MCLITLTWSVILCGLRLIISARRVSAGADTGRNRISVHGIWRTAATLTCAAGNDRSLITAMPFGKLIRCLFLSDHHVLLLTSILKGSRGRNGTGSTW